MKTTLRAALAVALLAGYYVLALAVLALAAVAAVLAVRNPSLGTVNLTIVTFVLAGALLGALVRTARHRAGPPGGLPVSRTDEPALWNEIDALAARVGTRPPDDVRLVPDVNAAVAERTRRLGLAAGPRHMIIGMPLLETLTVAELRAVLGHELGHFSGRHTRLGGITYRGAVALRHTSAALRSDDTFATALRKIFEGYAKIYFRVSLAVRRAQEIEADRFMVEVSGRDAAASALRTVRTTAAAWAFFLDRHAAPGTRYGLAPADLFGGFRALLAEPARQDELRKILAEPESADPYDSHPVLTDRLAAIERCAEPAGLTPDTRPATALLGDADAVRDGFRTAMFGADATVLDWDELAARGFALSAAEDALRLLTAAERVTGTAPATLGTVLTAIETGHGPALAAELNGGRPDRSAQARTGILAAHLRALVSSAVQRADGVTVRRSWTGAPVRLLGPAGTEIDLDDAVPADLGPDHPAALRTALAAWGADNDHRPPAPERAGIDLHGVLHGVQDGDGDNYDALVLDVGVLFVKLTMAQAMRGMQSDLPIRERVQRLLESSPGELLQRDGSWLLEADTVLQATMWIKKDTWVARLLVAWTDDDGDTREGVVRIKGVQPCSDPETARRTLQTLLGSRLTMTDEKI
ncbi:M48 family metallopeptidase [Spirillospora sp. NPDC052242]